MEENRKREEEEKAIWLEKKHKELVEFEDSLKQLDLKTIEDIKPSQNTLYIIGNGFDLMHRVPSSFYSFRDSLGKKNRLKKMLELALTPEDIWADFENSLAQINLDLIGNRYALDMWLDEFDFYEDDAGVAEFAMSVETAVDPVACIARELPIAFRKWVDKLEIGTDDKPLEKVICSKGKALSFNYTEFLETIYGLEDVCYIHGCRKNKSEGLVLGHRPGDGNDYDGMIVEPNDFREAAVSLAQNNVFDLYEQYDRDLTKDSQSIIEHNRMFFDGLKDVDQIVVMGHSMSPVDWDYFTEVNRATPQAQWYFGCFGLNDLKNMESLVQKLGLENYIVFRTDQVRTEPRVPVTNENRNAGTPKAMVFEDGETVVTIDNVYELSIDNGFQLVLPNSVRKVVILDQYVFLVMADLDETILLFNKVENQWHFVDELKSFEHQKLINNRLKHVYLDEGAIIFVYNNRIRKYDLRTGKLIINKQVKNAKSKTYKGEDDLKYFMG